MGWRVKRFFRKWAPVALVASVLWVGFVHWQRGGRSSVGSVANSAKAALIQIPVLGSYFKGQRGHYRTPRHRPSKSYSYAKRSKRGAAHRRHRRRR